MKLIGIEEHYLTADVRDNWETVGLAGIDPSVAVHSGEIERRLLYLADDRLALMDETGLDVQVLSFTTPALHDLRRESVDLARRANGAVARTTVRWPDRFQELAALPMTIPQEAALNGIRSRSAATRLSHADSQCTQQVNWFCSNRTVIPIACQ